MGRKNLSNETDNMDMIYDNMDQPVLTGKICLVVSPPEEINSKVLKDRRVIV